MHPQGKQHREASAIRLCERIATVFGGRISWRVGVVKGQIIVAGNNALYTFNSP